MGIELIRNFKNLKSYNIQKLRAQVLSFPEHWSMSTKKRILDELIAREREEAENQTLLFGSGFDFD
jgi:hypothetical protein